MVRRFIDYQPFGVQRPTCAKGRQVGLILWMNGYVVESPSPRDTDERDVTLGERLSPREHFV